MAARPHGKVKGYIFAGLTLLALLAAAVAMLFAATADKGRNVKKINAIRSQYLAESMIDISAGLITEQLAAKCLTAVYMYENPDEFAGKIIIDSDPIYLGDGAYDFAEVCAGTLEIISTEGHEDASCRISVINKTSNELKLHVMDELGTLTDISDYVTGKLFPIEYQVSVEYASVTLESSFTIAGLTYYLMSDDGTGMMTLGLDTGSATVTTTAFNYTGEGG